MKMQIPRPCAPSGGDSVGVVPERAGSPNGKTLQAKLSQAFFLGRLRETAEESQAEAAQDPGTRPSRGRDRRPGCGGLCSQRPGLARPPSLRAGARGLTKE